MFGFVQLTEIQTAVALLFTEQTRSSHRALQQTRTELASSGLFSDNTAQLYTRLAGIL